MTQAEIPEPPPFEERSFSNKVSRYFRVIGEAGIEKAFLAYHVLKDPETPVRAKMILGGSLAYLVMPLDAVPDLMPAVGYTDDIASLAAALLAVASSTRKHHHDAAKESVDGLFGRKAQGEASGES